MTALVDSGSAYTLVRITDGILEDLGIAKAELLSKNAVSFEGVAGGSKGYPWRLDFQLGWGDKKPVILKNHLVYFTAALSPGYPMLLGQDDFLKRVGLVHLAHRPDPYYELQVV